MLHNVLRRQLPMVAERTEAALAARDWAWGGRFHQLLGQLTYGGKPVYGFCSMSVGAPAGCSGPSADGSSSPQQEKPVAGTPPLQGKPGLRSIGGV